MRIDDFRAFIFTRFNEEHRVSELQNSRHPYVRIMKKLYNQIARNPLCFTSKMAAEILTAAISFFYKGAHKGFSKTRC